MGARKAPLVGGELKCAGAIGDVIVDRSRPRSCNVGAGREGGGVEGREGSGEDARDDERGAGAAGGGVSGAGVSRVGVTGWCSRRWIRLEKNPEKRFEARF